MCDQPYQPDTQQHNLRDRIAAALLERFFAREDVALDAADAVIEALGLQQEWSIGDDDGRILWLDGEEPVEPREGEVVEKRYITEWTTDE